MNIEFKRRINSLHEEAISYWEPEGEPSRRYIMWRDHISHDVTMVIVNIFRDHWYGDYGDAVAQVLTAEYGSDSWYYGVNISVTVHKYGVGREEWEQMINNPVPAFMELMLSV